MIFDDLFYSSVNYIFTVAKHLVMRMVQSLDPGYYLT